MNFQKLLAKLDDLDERCAEFVAADIVNEVSDWAAKNGHPSLVREWTPAAQTVEVRRYLAEAIAATAEKPAELPDGMLDLNEAAAILGYKPAGLRKIVAATKAGRPGPTIQFAQVGRGPIRFRRQWLDDFITGNIVKRPVKPRPKSKQPPAESKHGFDNRLYNI